MTKSDQRGKYSAACFVKYDTMTRPLLCIFMFGLLHQTVSGTACGLDHCIKCEQGRCTECTYGWYGNYCSKQCHHHCWFGGCEQTTGTCIQCSPGYYTESCNRLCPFNCQVSYDNRRYCNRTTGHCLEGCNSSFWGSLCDRICNENCEDSVCEQRDGSCFKGCLDGWFGETCNKNCPGNCREKRCSFVSGRCLDGCVHGFHGGMCNISCNNCIDEQCIVNEILQSFNCTRGCKDGWTSTDCQTECSIKCQDGKCGRNGRCDACSDRYYGEMCENECFDDCAKCDRTGICIEIILKPDTSKSTSNKRSEVYIVPDTDGSTAASGSAVLMCSTYIYFMAQMVIGQPFRF